ncbi:hypothetical protein BU26DRAFT_536022 [Trematosphaeria pertusa]|uniref:Uncharacterized protein n=1 Tax=Trematosphaeria pertusa TaxID=390896 RepID=A0A6A6HRK7_9PLEO|nr:hypothetical protein BU26DRAFT_536022 [Trematosphaeria pertusa]
MPKFDDRFARQNRCEPPPEFPLASPYSSIVHHLSGPNSYALTQIHPKTSGSVDDVRLLGPCFKTGRLQPLRQHPRRSAVFLPVAQTDAGLPAEECTGRPWFRGEPG